MDWTANRSRAGIKRKINDVDSQRTPEDQERDDEENFRPAFGFSGFAPASSSLLSPIAAGMNAASSPRVQKGPKTAGSRARQPTTATGHGTFASRMMAKMGYVEGQGLGLTGQGILNPVETVLRPQGVGLGSVKEKSRQAKAEAKREATRRGEMVETDSDDEHKRRPKRQTQGHELPSGSGTSTPKAIPRPKYHTAREINLDMEGLEVPHVLKELIDATGKEQKLLTSAAGLMTPMQFIGADEIGTWKIAERARHDLEAFADEWKGLMERKTFVESEEAQVIEEIDAQQSKLENTASLSGTTEALAQMRYEDGLDTRWEHITNQLEALNVSYGNLIDKHHLSEIAVAAIHPLFQESMEAWSPLSDPTYLVSYFQRLRQLLIHPNAKIDQTRKYRKSTTPYETLLYTVWLPRVRSMFLDEWDVHFPNQVILLLEGWKALLPEFIYSNLLNLIVVPKLTSAIKAWKPRQSNRNRGTSQHFPWWLFEWLRLLDDPHTIPSAPTGILHDARRKFRALLDSWDYHRGLVPGLELWKEALGAEFDKDLYRHVLPALAKVLREEFEVNPQDQNMLSFESVIQWKLFFKPSVLGLLLVTEFFPKWHTILHLWLTSDPNYEEIGQWFSWWKDQIPPEVNAIQEVTQEWNRGLQMMNIALDLGEKAKSDLPPPSRPESRQERPTEFAAHRDRQAPVGDKVPQKSHKLQLEEPSFRDIVEEWCADEGLLIVPLREAHLKSGLPLYRITASVKGKGGVVVYLKGDVVWAQSQKDKDMWEPVGLGHCLISRAEGK